MKNKIGTVDSKINVPRFNEKSGFETSAERSALMSKIRSSNTKPEIILRKALWGKGVRYRLNVKKLRGCPDIVINKYKVVVFVDGKFWHGYNWEEKKKRIKANREFWIPKVERNIQRDAETNIALESSGYKVLRFWGQEIKSNLENCLNVINQACHINPFSKTKMP